MIKHIYACLVVCVGWVFFRAGDMALALQYLKRMFLPWMYTASGYAVPEIVGHRTILVFVCAVLGCGIVQKAWKRVSGKCFSGKHRSETVCLQYGAAELVFCMVLLALSILAMVSSTYSAFLYMNF